MEKVVSIPDKNVAIIGSLVVPDTPRGIILFAHGSGSSRFSPRNNFVARELQKHGFATLLMDLLSPEEDSNYATRFDISLLARRLEVATAWLKEQPEFGSLPIGYFGASTGAAAAIQTAAQLGDKISAVVSRGGRPDLAPAHLNLIIAPTLLIVGGNDGVVIELNQQAFEQITATKELTIVPGATHLFEEPGTLEQVADLAADWFLKHL